MKKKSFSWIFFVLSRFNSQDTKGRNSVATVFSITGIAFGVMVLTVILSVMNGFQRGYIDTILQVSSGHIRLSGTKKQLQECENLNLHKYFFQYREIQTLLQNNTGRQVGILIRAIESDSLMKDPDFKNGLNIIDGSFKPKDTEENNYVIIGYELARRLSLNIGDEVNILAVSGSSNSELFPENKNLMVTGIFKTGYYAVDSSFAFISLQSGEQVFGGTEKLLASVKLQNQNNDAEYIYEISKKINSVNAESWRKYNHAFFGALRVEKNMMLTLVVLIFLVVSVNIYNSMRRSIYERKEEISVLASLGAYSKHIQLLFILNGFFIGFIGASLGLLAGLLLAININEVFSITENLVNYILMFFSILTNITNSGEGFAVFSPVYFYMDNVPVKFFYSEVLIVFLFGIFSSTSAAFIAAKKILKLKPAEVLRYE